MLAEYEFLYINSLNVSFKILWFETGGIHIFLTVNILINFCFVPLIPMKHKNGKFRWHRWINRWIDMFTFQFLLRVYHPMQFLLSYCQCCYLGIVRILGTVESLFSAAISETIIACGTVPVDHYQECFGCRVTVQHDWD